MYILRYPLNLAPHHDFYDLAAPVLIEGRSWSLLKQEEQWFLLVSGFQSPQEVQAYLPRLRQLLDCLMVTMLVTLDHTENVETHADPAARAISNASSAVISVEGFQVQTAFGRATVRSVSRPGPAFERIAAMAGSIPPPGNDPKLLIALDLYRAHDRDTSLTSRFLMLVMALEALAEPEMRPAPVVAVVDSWREDLKRRTKSPPPELADTWRNLSSEVAYRRYNSIADQIVRLVLDAMKPAGDEASKLLRKQVRDMYQVRSTLLHQGQAGDGMDAAFRLASQVTPRVLIERLQRTPPAPASR